MSTLHFLKHSVSADPGKIGGFFPPYWPMIRVRPVLGFTPSLLFEPSLLFATEVSRHKLRPKAVHLGLSILLQLSAAHGDCRMRNCLETQSSNFTCFSTHKGRKALLKKPCPKDKDKSSGLHSAVSF